MRQANKAYKAPQVLKSHGVNALLIFTLLFFSACSSEPDTGPGKVRWDREVCERCAMAVSDRSYSAQVRGGTAEKKTKLYQTTFL